MKEEDICKALDAINNGFSKKKASRVVNVPRSTIQFRLSHKFKKPGPGPPPILSAEAEETLAKWILECHKKGFPREKKDLLDEKLTYKYLSRIIWTILV
ncbi:hypothetical protein Zmor_003630 [Zophobas morio]|uniref:HTH psq-type domain-containing protein n=1 Tax=Zophobas morio TaxID=2755281 RepID=A0AA38HLU4_9CUCU|nr:hypothetical protein Zmor_003630 [Zophobas morio]